MATLDPEFDLRLRGALTAGQEAGRGLKVSSGYRSAADQARAINSVSLNVNKRPASFMDYARGIKGYAAPVGGSMHQKGLAADLEGDVPWMRENARRYGLRFPDSLSKTDPNHVEIDPNAWGPFQDPRDRGGAPSVTVPPSMGGVVGMLGPAPGSFRAAQGDQPAKSAAPAVAGMTQGAPPMAGAGMLGTWTPDEVNARRRMASGMIQDGMSSAPVQHWTQGLARVIGGLSGNMWMDQANKAQREGMAAGAQTMQDALAGGDPKAAIGGMLANPWTQDQGQKLATGMLANEIQSQTPDAVLARDAKRFALDNSRQNAPLERQMKEAQIAKLQREAATGDNPAAVREWQFFSQLPPDAQERYLTMKRSDKYLDTGTAFVRPNQANPAAPPVASVPKNVAEEARLKKVGSETGELQAGAPKAEASLRAADAKSDIVLNTIAEAKQMVGNLTAGFSGSLLSNIPGSGARDLRAKLDTLKANAGFAELQNMRDNSPTGGALGQVAVQELAMLQATITSLEQAQTPAQLSKALEDYEKFVRESKVRRKQAYDATYGAVRQAQPGAGGGTPAAVPSGNYVFDPATGQLRPR